MDSTEMNCRLSTTGAINGGSIPHKDQDQDSDSPAAKLGLWGTSFGFKLVVLKMESKDTPRKVADYYQNLLAK